MIVDGTKSAAIISVLSASVLALHKLRVIHSHEEHSEAYT